MRSLSPDTQRRADELVGDLVEDLLERVRLVTRNAERMLGELASGIVRRLPAQATRPQPWHFLLDEDDIAIMAEDRELNGDLGARGIAEAWLA